MKALASIPIFVYILFVLPNGADSCCCPVRWGHKWCYCNFFGCNCGECETCPPSNDAYCYYAEAINPTQCYKSNEKACARFWTSSRVRMTDID